MSALEQTRLIAIFGATGTGKSTLSLDVAEKLATQGRSAEIVNADAMQLYQGMNIGTAKLSVAERRGIPHHQLDVLAVTNEATVAAYQRHARHAINGIIDRGSIPILVGGSGLYVSSVIYDFQFPGRDDVVRARLEKELDEIGSAALYQRLVAVDPLSAQAVDPHNTRRIIRALEVLEVTGQPQQTVLPERPRYWCPTQLIGLAQERAQLVPRLNERVCTMWDHGILHETAALIPHGIEYGVTASKAIGYSQALRQLRGELTQEEAISQTQQLTRRYARRQSSWFTRYPLTTWIDVEVEDTKKIDCVLHAPIVDSVRAQ